MKVICVIPARKNSKRLKNKNLKILNGKPLIYWTIIKAIKIKQFDKIIISTDSKKILYMEKEFKRYKKIKFIKRPQKYSKDTTPMKSVIINVLNILKKEDSFEPSAIAILQPTSPLRKVSTIKRSIYRFIKNKPDFLTTIKEVRHNETPQMQFNLNKNQNSKKLNLKIRNKKRKYYVLDGGVIFIFNIKKNIFEIKGLGEFVEVKFPESIDIDTKEDFDLAKKFI
jgi:CMP-N,N'-diacetyllegionaminic acid synthase